MVVLEIHLDVIQMSKSVSNVYNFIHNELGRAAWGHFAFMVV